MDRKESTAGPATRRGGPLAGAGGSDAFPKGAIGPERKQKDARNQRSTLDAPTGQGAVLLSAVKAAIEDEKSPFEASMLQQYQQAMIMQLHAQMTLGGLLPKLPNLLPASALNPPPSMWNASSQPAPAQRHLSGSLMGAAREASQQAQGRRAYSTSATDGSGLSGFSPATMGEEELKKRRRKESNRESARRSRLRKQAECDSLQEEIVVLRAEVELLRKDNQGLRDLVTTLQGPGKP